MSNMFVYDCALYMWTKSKSNDDNDSDKKLNYKFRHNMKSNTCEQKNRIIAIEMQQIG